MVCRSKLRDCVLNVSAAAAFGLAVSAMGSTAAWADSCFVTPAKLSDEAIQAFLANPGALLQANPLGGYALTTQVRSLAGSETATVDELISLAATATPEQMTAIAAGLAQAAAACVTTRPDIAEMIQQALAASGNEKMIAAFAAASGDTQTAALGGTGAVGGGTVGGVGGATGGAVGGIGGTTAGPGASGTTATTTFSNGTTPLSANGSAGSISTTVESVSATQ